MRGDVAAQDLMFELAVGPSKETAVPVKRWSELRDGHDASDNVDLSQSG